MDGASVNKNALGMTTNSGITGNWWHILQAAWDNEYRWNSQIAFPTQNRNGMYYRSGLDDNTKWGSWVKLLDTNNYSSTLDSRYYTESEVNSLLSKKLDRVNLTTGSWNPRGYSLAADYFYNGGDLSISESGGQIHVSVDGYFWQNEGRYRVLDTSDVAGLKSNLTVHQYLSAADATWYPLMWGGNSHNNTDDSTGAVYKSYDKLSWQTSTQTLYATNIRTENIRHLSIGGGIYWNPNVESATDGSDAASITLVKSGIAGGTTLVLSQMNDTNDTIQFKTNTAARLYHNSYPILTTQNTYVSNDKGYINGTEITQVNNADKVDNRHAISTIPNTGIIYKAAIQTSYSLTSYWVRLASIPSINQDYEFVATIHVQSGHSNPGRSAILLVYLRGTASSLSKSFKICCNSNYDPNRFRLYYKDSDKTSEIWYQTTGKYDGIITTVISQSTEGSLYERLTLYSGSITAVQTPSMSTYLSAQVSTITDNISGNASNAYHLRINSANTWSTWYWAGQGGQPNWLWGSNDGTNMYVWNPSNFRVAYAASAGNAETLGGMPKNYGQAPFGTIPCIGNDGVMEIGRYIDYHYDNSGKYDFSTRLQATGNYRNIVNLPSTSGTLALINDVNNYYWANVKISTSSSTTTSPTVSNLTATNSIRMNNISLDNTNEINNITSGGSLNLNCRNSGDVSLCAGGGRVGIGTRYPSYELHVVGYTHTKGFGINPYYLSDSWQLPNISPGDGHTYRCLEISRSSKISCIIADKTHLPGSTRGVLLNFKEGFDGQIILLKDLQNYGSGDGHFWVMPSWCNIIRANSSGILVGQNQISSIYDDGHSRFLVYSSKYRVWIEFLCAKP